MCVWRKALAPIFLCLYLPILQAMFSPKPSHERVAILCLCVIRPLSAIFLSPRLPDINTACSTSLDVKWSNHNQIKSTTSSRLEPTT